MEELKDDYPVFKSSDADDDDILGEITLLSERGKVVTDIQDRDYTVLGRFLADDDFYQGLNMVTVIQSLDTGDTYGYFWWDDISKHGTSDYQPNGDEFGLEGYCEVENDWDTYVSFSVWVPVEPYVIMAWRETKEVK